MLESGQVGKAGVVVKQNVIQHSLFPSMTVKSLQDQNYCYAGRSASESLQSAESQLLSCEVLDLDGTHLG